MAIEKNLDYDPVKRELGKALRELKKKDPDRLIEYINQLSEDEANSVVHDEMIWARDKQLVDFQTKYSTTIYMAGRGFGKSYTLGATVKRAVEHYGVKKITVIAVTSRDLRATIVPAIMDHYSESHHNYPHYSPAKSEINWPNGAKCLLIAAEAGEDAPRGTQCEILLGDEACFYGHNEGIITQAMLTCRLGIAKAFFFTTPKKTPWTIDMMNKSKEEGQTYVQMITGSTYENEDNLADTFLETVTGQYKGTRLERVELYGELILESEGALWKMDTILRNEVDPDRMPTLIEFAIGVDPAITVNKKSDSTGIIVSGKCEDGFVYTLFDYTDKYTPQGWASRVSDIFDYYSRLGRTHVVVERNAGGDLVMDTLYRYAPNTAGAVDAVFSSASKLQRATPFSLLSEQDKIKFRRDVDGRLQPLYDELTGFDGSQKKSPDRFDAAVFSWSKLSPLNNRRVSIKELTL